MRADKGTEAREFLTVSRVGGQAVPMSTESPPSKKKLPILKLSAAFLVLAVGAYLVLRGVPLSALADKGVALMRSVGPVAFFLALCILPAFGAPLAAFTITAGEIFAPQLSMPGVIAATLFSMAVNLALTYWLSRYALRPLLSRLVGRYGYSIPRVTSDNALTIALAVRLTPGPPFFIQGYILGLAEVPFRLFMLVSWLCTLPWALGALFLGKEIFNGNFKLVFYGIGVIVAATAVVHLVRNRYVQRPR
jgi:uncharacterized membrane protein YdjX (TVP38/TMEM64 family)